MKREILLSGLLGGLVIFAWIILSTSIIPLSGDLPKQIPDDKEIHTLLKDKIPESGIYWLPGHEGQTKGLYPDYDNEPIFYIIHGGVTPGTMMAPTIVEILCIFLTPIIAAWILSMASETILARYTRRVLFVTGIGLLFAVYGDLYSQKPLDLVALSSLNNVIVWTLVGLVLAWRIKSKKLET
jgi:hypothetical protein